MAGAKGEPLAVYAEPQRGLVSQLLFDGMDSAAEHLRGLLTDSTRVEAREPGLE